MSSIISDNEISIIFDKMCEQSKSFQNFYQNEFPKLHGKRIIWKYNPALSSEGYANSREFSITLKKHPSELMNDRNYFLFCHEIGHLIQKEENYPIIRIHHEILRYLSSSYHEQEKISALLSSMIYDFSINSKLKQYAIEIFSKCLFPPIGARTPAFKLTYIFRYVIFRRNSHLFNRLSEPEIKDCFDKYNDKNLVEVGNKILDMISLSNISDTCGIFDSKEVKPIIKKIFTKDVFGNLMDYFPLPYEFELMVTQTDENILIVPKEKF
jgi:hypothetical protein